MSPPGYAIVRPAQAAASPCLRYEAERTAKGDRVTYREHYFPNTEPLAPAEMRVIALGTGRNVLRT